MKILRKNCVFIFLFTLMSSISNADFSEQQLVLSIYESNAEAQAVLTTKNNPDEVLAVGIAGPAHVEYTCKPSANDSVKYYSPSMVGMGHPGTAKFTDSEGVLGAAALDQLNNSIKCSFPDEVGKTHNLSGFYLGIAGHDSFGHKIDIYNQKSKISETKEAFLWNVFTNILSQRNFETSSSTTKVMEDDSLTMMRAVELKGKLDQRLFNTDFLQLTSFGVGYTLRDGALKAGSYTELDDSDGVWKGVGRYALGLALQQRYLKELPYNTTSESFDVPALRVLDLSPIVQQYAAIKMGGNLNNPDIGYEVPGLPTRKFNHYFSRLFSPKNTFKNDNGEMVTVKESMFLNEGGYTVTTAVESFDPERPQNGIDKETWVTGLDDLSKLIKENIEDPIIKLAEKLAKKSKKKDDHGKPVPLVLIGEFDLDALGIQESVLKKLRSLGWSEVLMLSPIQFTKAIAGSGVYQLKIQKKDEL